MTILFLETRGCDFSDRDNYSSDVGNHRICTFDDAVRGKDGKLYYLEFMLWRNRGHFRKYYKYNSSKLLKKPVFEIDIPEALSVDTQYDTSEASYRNSKLEKYISDQNLTYTRENILKVVNEISVLQYDNLVIVSNITNVNDIPAIKQVGGYREKYVLNNLYRVQRVEYTTSHKVYHYYTENGNGFLWDHETMSICG